MGDKAIGEIVGPSPRRTYLQALRLRQQEPPEPLDAVHAWAAGLQRKGGHSPRWLAMTSPSLALPATANRRRSAPGGRRRPQVHRDRLFTCLLIPTLRRLRQSAMPYPFGARVADDYVTSFTVTDGHRTHRLLHHKDDARREARQIRNGQRRVLGGRRRRSSRS